MKLAVLGSGSTVPHSRRTSAAYWLETSGGKILLDCSATAPHRMAVLGLDWPNLDSIWISHFHMDHIGGLGPLLAGVKHSPDMQDRSKPLRIFGPEDTKRLIHAWDDVNNFKLLKQPYPVEITEVTELEPFEITAGVEATAMKTPHTDESHAIHIRDAETTLVYSSDTGFDLKAATLGNGADLLVLECTFFKDKPKDTHLVLSEAIYLIRKARPKRAMLTHFYPEWDEIDFEEEVRKLSPRCKVIQAEDGLMIDF